MKPWIYIASPYTRGDQAQNVAFQLRIWDILAGSGVVTPIAPLWTHFQHLYAARPYKAWVAYDNEIIERCDACLRLDARNALSGYHQHESSGADGEVATFARLGRPVFYDVEESLQWASQFRSSSILRCDPPCGIAGGPQTAGTG
jgi:hypothetical protein